MPSEKRTKSARTPARKPPPAAKRKSKAPLKPKVVRIRRLRYALVATGVGVETPTDVFAVTESGMFTYLRIRGRGFDNGFKVAVSEKLLTTKSWPAPISVKALQYGRLLVAKFQVSSSTTTPVPVEETGQVDITVSGNGGAQSPTVTVPVVYFDPISTTRRP